jgi:hypothetical protein
MTSWWLEGHENVLSEMHRDVVKRKNNPPWSTLCSLEGLKTHDVNLNKVGNKT